MPGRLFLTRPIAEIAAALGGADWVGPEGEGSDLEPRSNIKPGENVLTVTRGRAFRMMRWGVIPVGRVNARGRPVLETIVNARSETVFEKSAYEGVNRCIVPADGWYEWTGKARRKTAWAIRSKSGAPLWFAAICDLWSAPGGRDHWQTAIVTCPPSADVAGVHDRMGVLLTTEDIDTWMSGPEEAAAALTRPAPEGSLVVSEADEVDWSGR